MALAPAALAATFTVTTNSDSGAGSLRAAITAANANPGVDTIAFNIGAGGPQVIAIATALPAISEGVVIDGTTQPGFAGTPIITLDGPNVAFLNGLTVGGAQPSTIRGLVIVHFFDGILVQSSGTTIVGNYIGIDATGSVAQPNTGGIEIAATADGVIIGGTTAADRNVVSGNTTFGIRTLGDVPSASDGNLIRGNIIGLDATGTSAVGNGGVGISIIAGDANRIGGTLPGERNIISANAFGGIEISARFSGTFNFPEGNVVQGNFIGTDITGTIDLGNGGSGISLFAARSTTLGGTGSAARNVIAGNSSNGISLGTACFQNTNCTVVADTVIAGNFIGVDVTGTQDLGNEQNGIGISGAQSTTIGSANVISGNTLAGILISSGIIGEEPVRAIDTTVIGNRIGTDVTGTVAIPNEADGIRIFASDGAVIGGTATGEGNLIRFNGDNGIALSEGAGNEFLGNSIDDNGGLGIDLNFDGVTPNDPLDADATPNEMQNYPLLTSATLSSSTAVAGTLHSTPNRTFRIEFFDSPAADPSGFGEGRTFLGFVDVITDAGGNAAIAATLPPVPVNSVITATATDLTALSTSEFSNAVAAAAAQAIPTLSAWALMLSAMLLAIGGALAVRPA